MRVQQWAVGIGMVAMFAAAAAAQDTSTTPAKKPGGLNKVAHNISNTSKKAGRDVKAAVKGASSDTHQTLKKAGNDTKAQAKRTTGYTTPAPTDSTRPGG